MLLLLFGMALCRHARFSRRTKRQLVNLLTSLIDDANETPAELIRQCRGLALSNGKCVYLPDKNIQNAAINSLFQRWSPGQEVVRSVIDVFVNNVPGALVHTNLALRFLPNGTTTRPWSIPIKAPFQFGEFSARRRTFNIITIVSAKLDVKLTDHQLNAGFDYTTYVQDVMRDHNRRDTGRPDNTISWLGTDGDPYLIKNTGAVISGEPHPRSGLLWNEFLLSTTYPKGMMVPLAGNLTESDALKFYQDKMGARKNRRSLLTVMHTGDGGIVVRSSQPTGKSSNADRKALLWAFPNSDTLLVDLRPRVPALMNAWFMSGGTEDASKYKTPGGKGEHMYAGIGNVDDVLSAYHKCNSADKRNCQSWNEILGKITHTLAKIVDRILNPVRPHHPTAVVLHCTDGWDRTPQMSLLVQIVLSHEVRSVDGFLSAFIREFPNRGHKCSKHYSDAGLAEKNPAPIIPQTLEVIRYLLINNPNEFEFEEDLLEWLAGEVYSHSFVEFEGDTAKIRDEILSGNVKYDSVWRAVQSLYANRRLTKNANFRKGSVDRNVETPYEFRTLPSYAPINPKTYQPWDAIVGGGLPFPGARARYL